MVGADLVLFLDAGTQTPAPFSFYEARPAGVFASSTHALLPEAVLSVFQQVQRRAPPPAFVLCVRGETFALGADLSSQARQHMDSARDFLRALWADPSAAGWRRCVMTGAGR